MLVSNPEHIAQAHKTKIIKGIFGFHYSYCLILTGTVK